MAPRDLLCTENDDLASAPALSNTFATRFVMLPALDHTKAPRVHGAAMRAIFVSLPASLHGRLSFDERIRGSHHIFTRESVEEILNLQVRSDGTAKPYQVRQVRQVILKYKLGGHDDEE